MHDVCGTEDDVNIIQQHFRSGSIGLYAEGRFVVVNMKRNKKCFPEDLFISEERILHAYDDDEG